MKNKSFPFLVLLSAISLATLISAPAKAHEDCYKQSLGIGWTWVCKPHVHRDSGIGKILKDADITNKNSAVREAGRWLDRHRIEGMKSARRLCDIAGYDKCVDPSFLQTYAGVKSAANANIINGADSCGGLVDTAINGGKQGIQLYAMAKGVAVPPELLNLGASQYIEYGMVSCKVVYGRLPDGSNLARANINGTSVTASKEKIGEFRQVFEQIQNVEKPAQNNQNQNNSAGNAQAPKEEPGFIIKW